MVAPGSNGELSSEDVQRAEEEFKRGDIVLIQLEIPIETVMHVAKLGARLGKKVILNPAPARELPDDLYKALFLITPNKSETKTLTGIEITNLHSMEAAATLFQEKGVANVIITLGAEGAYLHTAFGGQHISITKVTAIDSTAAGDIFNGALAVAIAENKSLPEAVEFANRAAAISVTKMGAQSSAPYRKELLTITY